MIWSEIWENPHFAALNYRQRLMVIGLITNADDQGRLRGHPNRIKSLIFSYSSLSRKTIERDLTRIAENETIMLYPARGQPYIQIINWWQYQRMNWAAPSKYPAPPDWKDRINYRQGDVILCYNWRNKEDTCNAQGIAHSLGIQCPNEEPINSYSKDKVSKRLSKGKVSQDAGYQRNPEKPECSKEYSSGKYGKYIVAGEGDD